MSTFGRCIPPRFRAFFSAIGGSSIPLALLGLLATLAVYLALAHKQAQAVAASVHVDSDSIATQIGLRMDARVHTFVRMARRWDFAGGLTQAAWEDDAVNCFRDFPDLQAFERLDASHHIRWVVPLLGNEGKLNLNLTLEARRKAAVDLALATGGPAITRTIPLFGGGLGFIVYVPLYANGHFDGFIAAVFNVKPCFDYLISPSLAPGEEIAIFENGRQFYTRYPGSPIPDPDWLAHSAVRLYGVDWDVRTWPTASLTARLNSKLPAVVFGAGVLASFLLGAVGFFAHRASRQAAKALHANAALRELIDHIETLEGLLPICTSCKRVREDSGYWTQIDTYLNRHTKAELSHGYCPECAAKAFTDLGEDVPGRILEEIEQGNFE